MLEDAAMQQLRQILPQLTEGMQEQFVTRQLANITHACVALQLPAVVTALLPLLLRFDKLAAAEPQHISNVLWAVANLGLQLHEDELQAMLQRFVQILPTAKCQELSNMILAVASMGRQLTAPQLRALLQSLVMLLPETTAQGVSNTLWAVASMGQQAPAAQLQQLLGRFMQLLPDVTTQEISNTLWAVAEMGQQLPAAQLQPLLQQFMQLMLSAKPQGISNTLWAVAEMGQYLPVQLLDSLGDHLQLLQSGEPRHLSGIAYALAQLGYSTEHLPGVVLQQAVAQLGVAQCFDTQACANLCWAAAILDLQAQAANVLKLAAVTAATADTWGSCIQDNLRHWQLYQAHLWLLDTGCAEGLLGVLTGEQLQQCQASWLQQLERQTAVSRASAFHKNVYQTLLRLPASTWQEPPIMEQRTADGNFSMDIAAVRSDGVRLAIEADGPSHFLQPIMLPEKAASSAEATPGPVLNGPTKSRNRAYAARDYVVVSVPGFVWKTLNTDQQKQEYMLARVNTAAS